MKTDKDTPLSVIILLAVGFIGGLLVMYMILNWARPTGWILSAKGTDIADLTWEEARYIRNLLRNGNVFTQTDLLENFVAYYHTLITILITLILFLAGFLTYNFYKSRKEYTDLMERELRIYLNTYQRLVEDKSGNEEELEKFEYLQKWVRDYITRILENSDNTLMSTASEAILSVLINDEDFLAQVKSNALKDNVEPNGKV